MNVPVSSYVEVGVLHLLQCVDLSLNMMIIFSFQNKIKIKGLGHDFVGCCIERKRSAELGQPRKNEEKSRMAKRGPSSSPNHTRGDVAESPMTSSDLVGLEELTSLGSR